MIGQTISHYEITEKLGEGGMGEVYRAQDTTLKREVAIKVLPEQFTQDTERLARFQREAQVLASLNHPNISAIHSLEHSEGVHFLAMELVEGETLAERVAKGPLPVEEALEVSRQIAEALEAAHESGIIHRDLKPANIKLKPDGTVKVLDFGLAKTLDGDGVTNDGSDSPTITEMGTASGVILGTASYMSPEQARGKTVDRRTDVWAFGCVLYEMLTGKRAFAADNVPEALAAVLTIEVDLDLLPAETPRRLRRVLVTCLQKDPAERVRDIRDVRLVMAGAFETELIGASDEPSATSPSRLRLLSLAAGVLLVGFVAGLVAWMFLGTGTSRSPTVTRFFLSDTDLNGMGFAVSPDGSRIVYAARSGDAYSQLFVRARDELEARPIPNTESGALPFFSPDGEWVGYFALAPSQGRRTLSPSTVLMKISLSGGPPVTLAQGGPLPGGLAAGATWGPDDIIVYSFLEVGGGLMAISAKGGEVRTLTTEEDGENHWLPAFSPDGGSVFFTISTVLQGKLQDKRVAVLSLATGEYETVVEGAAPRVSPSGHLVFGREDSLWAAPFDFGDRVMTGAPRRIVEGVQLNIAGGEPQYALANDGTLVYLPSSGSTFGDGSLVWVTREGQEEPIPLPPAAYRYPTVSFDGDLADYVVHDISGSNWTLDLRRNVPQRMDFEGSQSVRRRSPDGRRFVFAAAPAGSSVFNVYLGATDSPEVSQLTSTQGVSVPGGWSADGEWVVYSEGKHGARDNGLWIVRADGSEDPRVFRDTPARETQPSVSPNGRWLAYSSDRSGEAEILVEPFPASGVATQVSAKGGTEPVWSKDGRELYYRAGVEDAEDRYMMAVPVGTGEDLEPGRPVELFEDRFARTTLLFGDRIPNYDVSPEGRFLMIRAADNREGGLIVVLNWFEELKRLLPVQ